MGRLVAFIARVASAGWPSGDNQTQGHPGVLGVGISEHTAVLVSAQPATLCRIGCLHAIYHSPQQLNRLLPARAYADVNAGAGECARPYSIDEAVLLLTCNCTMTRWSDDESG